MAVSTSILSERVRISSRPSGPNKAALPRIRSRVNSWLTRAKYVLFAGGALAGDFGDGAQDRRPSRLMPTIRFFIPVDCHRRPSVHSPVGSVSRRQHPGSGDASQPLLGLHVNPLDDGGLSLTDADTQRRQSVIWTRLIGYAPPHFVQQRGENAGAGTSEWVPESHGSAVDVRELRVELEFLHDDQRLGGEGLVNSAKRMSWMETPARSSALPRDRNRPNARDPRRTPAAADATTRAQGFSPRAAA